MKLCPENSSRFSSVLTLQRPIVKICSELVEISSKLVEISSEPVRNSSELVSTISELLKISVFKIATTTDIVGLAPSVYASRSSTYFFNNIKIVVNIESRKTMKLQTESIPNTLNTPKEQEKALRLGS